VELEPAVPALPAYGDLFAHVIGYVGRVDEKDLESLGEGNAALTHVGKSGLERYYEASCAAIGYEQVETNVQGRAIRTIGRVPARAGTDLRLSIDVNLQQAMVTAFGSYEGAAIAMDPRSGEILAWSACRYDPNLFVNGISHADFKALNDNPSRPQFNRLVLGGVAPGSTLKPLIGLAGLDSGVRRPEDKILSTGMFYLPGVSRGWGDATRRPWLDRHAQVDRAVGEHLLLQAGAGPGHHPLRRLHAQVRLRPADRHRPDRRDRRHPAVAGVQAQSAQGALVPGRYGQHRIGQGDWKVTPLQLVRAHGGIANGSCAAAPGDAAEGGLRCAWTPLQWPEPRPITDNPATCRCPRGHDGTMRPGGSGYAVSIGAPYQMAGKTGTAQVVSRKGVNAVIPQPADAPAPPFAVRRLRAGREPASRSRSRWRRWLRRPAAAPIARKFRCVVAGQDAATLQPRPPLPPRCRNRRGRRCRRPRRPARSAPAPEPRRRRAGPRRCTGRSHG
jgi:penicillin-binding protein 2